MSCDVPCARSWCAEEFDLKTELCTLGMPPYDAIPPLGISRQGVGALVCLILGVAGVMIFGAWETRVTKARLARMQSGAPNWASQTPSTSAAPQWVSQAPAPAGQWACEAPGPRKAQENARREERLPGKSPRAHIQMHTSI